MRSCSLKVQNLVLKVNLVNRRRVVYSRTYGNKTYRARSYGVEKLRSNYCEMTKSSKILIIWKELEITTKRKTFKFCS